MNGKSATEGRLEIKHNGVWGTVCDDGFTNAASTVVCRQVGWRMKTAEVPCN